ncbi:hypothetical protein [uncultured Clostridium sp.]|mgnify:CR=1 FL=1|uniref:hypothetical protein n=1 Tax=uncultured Clostridium sp. TaxID=59620 RepID=UPI0027DC940D|nr:hypothetical protein [uncultured Clostridium sp.]
MYFAQLCEDGECIPCYVAEEIIIDDDIMYYSDFEEEVNKFCDKWNEELLKEKDILAQEKIAFHKKVVNKCALTTNEVCKITGLSRARISKKVQTGKLDYIRKTSGGFIFHKDDIKPNLDRNGHIVKRFYNNEFDVINLLLSGYKLILTGSVGTGKTTLLEKIKKYAEENSIIVKLFDDGEIPKNFLSLPYSLLAVVQSDNEIEALNYLSQYLSTSINEIREKIDFICTLESNQITILKIDEV